MTFNRFACSTALLAAAVVSNTGGASEISQTAGTVIVKIGFASPLTGAQAHLGKDNQNGAQLAVDEINAKGLVIDGRKIQLQLISEDDAADPRTGTQVAQQLVDYGVVAVVGHMNSGVAIPAARIYNAAHIALLSTASNPGYTQLGYRAAFRLTATDANQGPALAAYAHDVLKTKRVAVIDDASAFGLGLADEFSKSANAIGMQIVSRDAVSDKSIDFKSVLTKIKSEKPDAIMFGGMDAMGAPLVRQAIALGIAVPLLGGDGICTPTMIDLAKQAAQHVICTSVGAPLASMQRGEAFSRSYEARFQTPVRFLAPFFYDGVYIVANAMKRSNSTSAPQVLSAVQSTNYSGVTGHFAYTARGDITDPVVTVYTEKNGQFEPATVMHMAPK
ncbi:branched-chain amino acid ABC transporter substrate-binding protein [Paraburkholderia sp. Ac-20340]|uniref:branched-chain amino acid ABC transporter substrate-binding protein n=1 Tax=Paraburkholderia sp. Ac-20340 TaxID=2703888 RepID=UPI00197E6B02|nr:branched-chain amino acid ABC transporter substrate-binding protein [Paraburkholderia sp. Ac-20340]MBN3854008.1 branched-chain amino acid ABC transporter substrate-binding protein [Paraburkholderia sp. Ac-20340]